MKKPTIPEFVEMKRELVEEHLSNYLENETGCWEYQGCCQSKGYGFINTSIGSNKCSYTLHRLSYYYHNNIDPCSLVVRHDCDNRVCINPAHLRLGTAADNNRDCMERGRTQKGEKHYLSKLTNECVINIKRRLHEGNETQAEIAKDFGVSPPTINSIRIGRNWKHVQLPSESRTKELHNLHQLPLFTI